MKILSLSFENLNSLYGKWEIDFTEDEYEQDGLFAIIGPTGSGKSTILDAICLALYGKTPRLDSIGLQGNEIMSRNSASCFAEVTFKSHKGVYRCHWEQHRAHNRVDGNLVDSTHEFSDVTNEKVLYTKKREVAQAVEEATGMNFNRFTRSMMLAQGEFAAFLHADSDQRSPILEQITGTELYSIISKKVHQFTREHSTHIEILQEAIDQLQPLSAQQKRELKSKRELSRLYVSANERRVSSLQQTLHALHRYKEIEEKLKRIATESNQLASLKEEISIKRALVDKAQRAVEVDPFATQYENRKKRIELSITEQESYKEQHIELEREAESSKEELERVTEVEKKGKEAFENIKPILRQTRKIDQKLVSNQKEQDSYRRKKVDHYEKLREKEEYLTSLTLSLKQRKESAKAIESYLHDNKYLSTLSESLPTLRKEAQAIVDTEKELKRLNDEYETEKKSLATLKSTLSLYTSEIATLNDELEPLVKQQKRLKERSRSLLQGRAKKDVEKERTLLQEKQLLLTRIANLEEHRAHLKEGEACPLCGSLEHPLFSEELQEDTTAKEIESLTHLLESLEEIDLSLSTLQESINSKNFLLTEKTTLLKTNTKHLEELTGKREEKEREISKLNETLKTQKAQFYEKISEWHINPHNNISFLLEQLEEGSTTFTNKQKEGKELSQESEIELSKRSAHLPLYHSLLEELSEMHSTLTQLKEKYRSLYEERISLLEERDVDEVELEYEMQQLENEHNKEEASKRSQKIQQSIERVLTTLSVVEKQYKEDIEELKREEKVLEEKLREYSFSSYEEYRISRLDSNERSELAKEVEKWDKATERLANDFLTQEREKRHLSSTLNISTPVERVQRAIERVFSYNEELFQNLGAINEKLSTDKKLHLEIKTKREELEKKREVYALWEMLNNLIGSHDGKKFRNFAQTLTFELLIAHANEHLKSLSDRYLLTSDSQKPLEFSVIDLYQAQEVRSARNLSGGESFLVSLALSLGLSTIASDKVQVDSLFLDEGFGTLDEVTLESALSALTSFKSQGKLIGIISHVGALPQRIPTQIEVIPLSGGMSKIVGPGISRLA